MLLKHFAVLVLLCLQILAKQLSLKVTKHEKIHSLATTKHNSINALDSKSLNDNVVTDRKFQIINSELEKYFECVPMSNRGVFSLQYALDDNFLKDKNLLAGALFLENGNLHCFLLFVFNESIDFLKDFFLTFF